MASQVNFPTDQLFQFDPVPELVGKQSIPAMDFNDFLNFDNFSSAEESGTESSPQTISVNHTPSPGVQFAPSPPQYDNDMLMSMFNTFAEAEKMGNLGGPSNSNNVNMGEIFIKQEPVEQQQQQQFPIQHQQHQQHQQPIAPAPTPVLPQNQQEALQQLLANLMQYQTAYGFGNDAGVNNAAVTDPTSTAINPSLVFAPTQTPAMTLTPSSGATANTPSVAASTPAINLVPPPMVPDYADEPLQSINDEAMRSTRANSTYSMDGIDDKIDKLVPLSSIFSAGRGKGGKKGGGMSSVVRGDDEDLDDDDSWRPSPEEYKKLSSKEKRQLRNKLSARAFRTRRKDYIGTLEAHIKDRDTVIDSIRDELLTSRAEAQDLRRELEALKTTTMRVLHPESAEHVGQAPALMQAAVAQPTPIPAVAPSVEALLPPRRLTSIPVNVNTRKDLAMFDTTRSFWGGNDLLSGGGNTICHAVFSPDIKIPEQPNLNPLLNKHRNDPASKVLSLAAPTDGGRDIESSTFAEWAENTPYSMRSMDSYRTQLWSRLAREAAADKAGVPADLRPKFFVNPTKDDPAAGATKSAAAVAATAATTAAEHVMSKLTSSFWAAFSGSSSKLDSDKLAAVVTGKARLAVIDVDKTVARVQSVGTQTSSTTPKASTSTTPDDLAHAMAGLKVATGTSTSESMRARENPLGVLGSFFKGTPMSTRA